MSKRLIYALCFIAIGISTETHSQELDSQSDSTIESLILMELQKTNTILSGISNLLAEIRDETTDAQEVNREYLELINTAIGSPGHVVNDSVIDLLMEILYVMED